MARNRTDFTDAQRAEIYRLDRATCSFTGRNLWILDYGIDPCYEIDWADHIIPASKGGPSEIENGAAACWSHNFARSNASECKYLFRRGKPTSEHQAIDSSVSSVIQPQLLKFSNLFPSDWYLNRGLWHLWLACLMEHQVRLGKYRSRRKEYYASASAKALAKWRRSANHEGAPSLEVRGLIPNPLEADQELFLSARSLTNQTALIDLVEAMLEPYIHTKELLSMTTVDSTLKFDKAQEFISKNEDIPGRFCKGVIQGLNQRSNKLSG